MGEGPSESIVRFRNFPFGCNIKESAHANDCVTKEALGFMACSHQISLQPIIEQLSRVADVSPKICDGGSNGFRDNKPVRSAERLYKAGHDSVVKLPNDAVRRLERVREWFRQNDIIVSVRQRV